jgi:hypothetical protein
MILESIMAENLDPKELVRSKELLCPKLFSPRH